jgi:hypothetical protein
LYNFGKQLGEDLFEKDKAIDIQNSRKEEDKQVAGTGNNWINKKHYIIADAI